MKLKRLLDLEQASMFFNRVGNNEPIKALSCYIVKFNQKCKFNYWIVILNMFSPAVI